MTFKQLQVSIAGYKPRSQLLTARCRTIRYILLSNIWWWSISTCCPLRMSCAEFRHRADMKTERSIDDDVGEQCFLRCTKHYKPSRCEWRIAGWLNRIDTTRDCHSQKYNIESIQKMLSQGVRMDQSQCWLPVHWWSMISHSPWIMSRHSIFVQKAVHTLSTTTSSDWYTLRSDRKRVEWVEWSKIETCDLQAELTDVELELELEALSSMIWSFGQSTISDGHRDVSFCMFSCLTEAQSCLSL